MNELFKSVKSMKRLKRRYSELDEIIARSSSALSIELANCEKSSLKELMRVRLIYYHSPCKDFKVKERSKRLTSASIGVFTYHE